MPLIEGCRNAPGILAGGIIHKIRGEDLVAVPCPNMEVVHLKQRLAAVEPQLLKVKHEPKTPLFQRGLVDRTASNLFLKSTAWPTFLRHFKWVVGSRDLFVRVVSDMTLVNVYVGNHSVKSRLKTQLEEQSLIISNSIEDLLSNLDLVVIRLGGLVHSNRAAANVLHEALLLRKSQGRPSWLVEPPWKAFAPYTRNEFGGSSGMPCCNDDVLRFVNEHFETLHLEATEDDVDDGLGVDVDETDPHAEGPSEFGEAVPDEPPLRSSKGSIDDEVDAILGPARDPAKKRRRF